MTEQHTKTVDVIIPIFNGYPFLQACLNSVIKHFDDNARLILIDDGSSDPLIPSYLEELKQQANFPVVIEKNHQNQGFVKTVNQGMKLSNQNDVILLNSDTIVTKNWIRKLRTAAYSKENIATVTPMSNNATIFSVPKFGISNSLPEGFDLDTFADLIEQHTLHLYPEVPTGHGFCFYIKRTSLNLLGFFDEDYGKGCEEENDFCMRAISHSLCNIMADDTFIYHAGGVSYQDDNRIKTEQINREKLLTKYPFYLDLVNDYITNRPLQIWDNIQAQIDGLSVGIDGRCLNQNISGTQRYLLELLKSYTEDLSDIKVELLISNGSQKEIIDILTQYQLSCFPKLIEESQLDTEVGNKGWDIFHVTFQGLSLPDLATVRPYAKRVVNTWQDFILFSNPYYFNDFQEFEHYRFNSRVLLESIDGVIAISDHVKQNVVNQNLVEKTRITRIYHGLNQNRQSIYHSLPSKTVTDMGLLPQQYLLFVGNDFLHKNLEATVNVFKETLNRGYNYQLVIVGKAVGQGGNIPHIKADLESDVNLQDKIFFLNYLSDEALNDLYCHAGVLLYLSNAEGFGLPPLEAFAHDCPVVASKLTSIPEVVGNAANCFHPGEINNIASEVIRLIENQSERDRAIQKGRERVNRFDWKTTAQQTIQFYYHLLRLPPNPKKTLPSLYLNSQKLEETQTKLNQAYSQIEAMESSKFWKLRQKWIKLKSWFGLAQSE